MSAASEFRESLGDFPPEKYKALTERAKFTFWFTWREIGRLSDEELEVLLAQFRVEVSE